MEKQQKFSNWLLDVGEGLNFVNDLNEIEIPLEILDNSNNVDDFIKSVYGDLNDNFNNREYLIGRAILTAKNEDTDMLTEMVSIFVF